MNELGLTEESVSELRFGFYFSLILYFHWFMAAGWAHFCIAARPKIIWILKYNIGAVRLGCHH